MNSKEKKRPRKRSWMVALVPLFGKVHVGGTLRPRWQGAILIGDDATDKERELFYQILIEIRWLPPEARAAILQALDSSLSKRNLEDETRRMGHLEYQIKVLKRPLKEIAADEGITIPTLKQQLQRFRKRERLDEGKIARIKKEIAKELARRRKQKK
jgi:hypothetical protein